MNRSITMEALSRYSEEFNASGANIAAMNAVTANGVKNAAKRWTAKKNAVHEYSIRLENKGVTSQKSSGRCWMFAALNCLRFQVIQKWNLDEFELSQNFTCFYDKLEKSNYFLENILKTLDLDAGSRIVSHLLSHPIQDGGQWDMIRAIIQKYGVVPKSAMPESACSSSTKDMNQYITAKLREYACRLRKEAEAGKTLDELRLKKKEMMEEVYRMLCICLGTPPAEFDFELRTKDGSYLREMSITPHEFYEKYVGVDLDQYISIIHAPTKDKPYRKSYTVKFLGNVVGAAPVKYVNLPVEELKRAAVTQLKDGEPVWFGCDVGQSSERNDGVMDLDVYDFETLFSTTFSMSKADRLDYGHSKMSHAMVFQGVNLDENGSPTRWCVENSWGADVGKKGMYLMTDQWFDEYMFQIVVQKKYLTEEILNVYAEDPIELEPWDPMGALAQ